MAVQVLKTGYIKIILSQFGGNFLAIRQVNCILCLYTREAGFDAWAVHGN